MGFIDSKSVLRRSLEGVETCVADNYFFLNTKIGSCLCSPYLCFAARYHARS
jgi:hypothetical protein